MANALLSLRRHNTHNEHRYEEDEHREGNDIHELDEHNQESENGEDIKDLEFELDPSAPRPIHLRDLEDLRTTACNALTGHAVTVSHRNTTKVHLLTQGEAFEITMTFFRTMVGGLLARVTGVIGHAKHYNMSIRAEALGDNQDIPEALRAVFKSLTALTFSGDGLNTIQGIGYQLALVSFNRNWERVKESIQQDNAMGREILTYISQPGRKSKVSLAKAVLCEELGITSHKFDTLYKSRHVPAAMVSVFGKGAIMYLRKGTSGRVLFPFL
ncbi:hypothetical protein OQA88_5951 [Cercophora sp. LCS_1]